VSHPPTKSEPFYPDNSEGPFEVFVEEEEEQPNRIFVETTASRTDLEELGSRLVNRKEELAAAAAG
jgi:hypothetical protein